MEQGHGIIKVIDGFPPKGVEGMKQVKKAGIPEKDMILLIGALNAVPVHL